MTSSSRARAAASESCLSKGITYTIVGSSAGSLQIVITLPASSNTNGTNYEVWMYTDNNNYIHSTGNILATNNQLFFGYQGFEIDNFKDALAAGKQLLPELYIPITWARDTYVCQLDNFEQRFTTALQPVGPLPEVGCGTTMTVSDPKTCTCTNSASSLQTEIMINGDICCGWYDPTNTADTCLSSAPLTVQPAQCGEILASATNSCACTSLSGQTKAAEIMADGKSCCGWYDPTNTFDSCVSSDITYKCGSTLTLARGVNPDYSCKCDGTNWQVTKDEPTSSIYCCGWRDTTMPNNCSPVMQTLPGADPPGGGTGGATEEDPEPTLNIFDGPTSADFKLLNPLAMFNSPYEDAFSSPAGIINRALRFAFPLAGLILFVMIVWGGFEILSGATNSKGVQAGKQRITAALLGFGLLFVSFWIIQIVEYIFNLAIL